MWDLRPARSCANGCATPSGTTCTTTTSSRCRTSGSIPWYAAWDLAFHTLALAIVDPDFAKSQLDLMLRNDYLHPNGQMPAYEWNFGDVNPPVHAYATMQIYLRDKERKGGKGDIEFLKYAFAKLLANFTWWINRKDRYGNNVFEGGFLGLDNIGVFDRSAPLPTGGSLEQADGTAWMVFFSQQMLRISVELALHDPLYEEFVSKFFEHTMWMAGAMDRMGDNQDEMWDEADGFFYDVLRLPNGEAMRLKVRSMVGLLPLAAVAIFEEDVVARLPTFRKRAREFVDRHPQLTANLHMPSTPGVANRRMVAIVNEEKLRRILARMLDENEFYGPHGIRALSRAHLAAAVRHALRRARSSEWAICPAIRTVACLAAIRTGVGRSGCRSTWSSTSRCCGWRPTMATLSRWNARLARGAISTCSR